MSWSFSLVLVEEFSEANCLDGEPYALSNKMPMHDQSSWPDKMTKQFRHSLFGTMCVPLTENRGEELLMWFRGAFHAKTSVSQAKELESQERDQDCGKKWQGLLVKYHQDLFSLKTVLCSEHEDSTLFSKTLPIWGMMQNGECSELVMSELHTNVTECGLLPTPTANSYGTCQGGAAGRSGKIRPSLQTMAAKNLWPTPTCYGNSNTPKNGTKRGTGLATAVKNWPTPNARDWKDTSSKQGNRKSPNLGAAVGGKLSPIWVEWMMGWPINWTSLSVFSPENFCIWNDTVKEWWDVEPENIPRTCQKLPFRIDRLKCLGNGQVPMVVEAAWKILTKN